MIDWIEFYAVSAIFQSCNGGDYKLNVSLAALTSLLFIETQRNGLLRAKEVVILDTGHHLTSHPMDMTTGASVTDLSNETVKAELRSKVKLFSPSQAKVIYRYE